MAMGKTVHKSKFSEWQGLDKISQTVHAMRCIWREISKDDFGIDGEIEIVVPKPDGEGFETTGGILKVQAKSGASYIAGDTPKVFTAKVNKDDLETWSRSNFPVLFIVYHPHDDQLYWKEIRTYAQQTLGIWQAPHKIVFDKNLDVFTPDSIETLKEIANVSEPRVSFEERERLLTNLLPAKIMPVRLWSASCTLNPGEVHKAVPGRSPAFLLHEKRLFTFTDLFDLTNEFRDVVDRGDIEEHNAHEWWDDEDQARLYVRLLNFLLGDHLNAAEVYYHQQYRRYYFALRSDQTSRSENWYSIRTNRNDIRTVAKYYTYGRISFYRHDAAKLQFLQLGSVWCLQIEPMYLFTTDGREPWEGKRAREYAIQKKAKETNQHVLNHVLFWSSFLARSRAKDDIEVGTDAGGTPLIVLERMPAHGVAEFAVPHDPAVFDPIEPQGQQLLFLPSFKNDEEAEVDDED